MKTHGRKTKAEQEANLLAKKAEKAALNNKVTEPVNNNSDMKDVETIEPEVTTENSGGYDSESGKEIPDPLLSAPTIDREYSRANVEFKGERPDSIEEPIIEQQTVDFTPETNNLGQDLGSSQQHEPERPPFTPGEVKNPAWQQLSSKQKNYSAEHLADTILNAYVQLHEVAAKLVIFDDEKAQIKALNGTFDYAILDIEIPMSEDGSVTITVKEFLDSINKQLKETIVVKEEFIRINRPILIEILRERGLGLTPLQELLINLGTDIIPKTFALIAIKSSFNQVLKMGMQLLAQYKAQGYQAQQPTYQEPAQQNPPPAPNAEPSQNSNLDISLADAEANNREKRNAAKNSKAKGNKRGRKKKAVVIENLKEPEEQNK